ncbi:MAG: prenyltransferase/squalene oxidase repeat-containing protein [Bryobacteraceae bacterium]
MESLRARALSSLLVAQNPDGGWGYRGGVSWTEPTALVVLALRHELETASRLERGVAYLASLQRADGGWSPHPSVDQSTWVTSLALLALAGRLDQASRERAVAWLLRQSGEETRFLHRLRMTLLGVGGGRREGEGWPWFPDTAAWVSPTALTIIALEQFRVETAAGRVSAARRFLWSRMCQDGGWNHGSTRALGYEAPSYPETTGQALLAMRGQSHPKLPQSIEAARRHLRACRSSSAMSWLRLGLLAHSQSAATDDLPHRGAMDTALWLLAERASGGADVFRGDA